MRLAALALVLMGCTHTGAPPTSGDLALTRCETRWRDLVLVCGTVLPASDMTAMQAFLSLLGNEPDIVEAGVAGPTGRWLAHTDKRRWGQLVEPSWKEQMTKPRTARDVALGGTTAIVITSPVAMPDVGALGSAYLACRAR